MEINREPEFIDEAELAAWLSIPLRSLRDRRIRGDLNIPYVRIGKRQIRYHIPTVRGFLLEQSIVRATTTKEKNGTIEMPPITIPPKVQRGRRRLSV